jgi:hypothetical protein
MMSQRCGVATAALRGQWNTLDLSQKRASLRELFLLIYYDHGTEDWYHGLMIAMRERRKTAQQLYRDDCTLTQQFSASCKLSPSRSAPGDR